MQDQPTDPLVGVLVDHRYRVRSRLARGGMSTVYLATDQRLDRDVALKVLHPHLSSDENFLGRLGREAKAAARLSHPHVVGVLDQGNDGSLAYLVMEYIPGHTLRDVIRERAPLTPRLALALIDPLIEGLAAAHAAGLVHRDVKPENVLIADDGRIKVGDFGLARAVTTSTSTGTLIGTVAYIAPELVLGQPSDARSDIYSAGIVLYELLTGHQPFEGEVPVQVAYQHVHASVPAPSERVPGLAADLDELVQWCTATDPEARPVDADALLGELRHIRTSLSDADLDFVPAGHRPRAAGPVAGPAAAGPVPPLRPPSPTSGDAHPTELVGPESGAVSATEFIGQRNQPTSVIPARARLELPPDTGPVAPPPSKRELKRTEREARKQSDRAAATPAQSLRQGKPRRRFVIWLAVLLVLALLGALAGWFFGLGPGALAAVPPLQNKTVAEAQATLSSQGFSSQTRDVFDETILQGKVVGSDPPARTQIRKFQPVTLLVSKGPELFSVPALTAASLDQAKDALNASRLALGKVTEEYNEEVRAGTVTAQDPGPGNQVRSGTPVALTVSKGPKPIPVPNLVGQDQDSAVKALSDLGLKASVAPETVFDRKVPKGSVSSQSPADGTLTRGGSVTLTISKGPKMVPVPDVFRKSETEATRLLKDAGFDVKVSYAFGTAVLGIVAGQDKTGTAPEGSTVTITVT